MGNTNQKKKKLLVENILPTSPKSSKDNLKEFWLFGRPDKLNTAGPKGVEEPKRLSVLYTVSQHYQENVFIEGSRPQFLEDLHTEAQEGLKILQEEHRNGVSFPDDESVASTNTQQPEQDISSKDEDGSAESRSPTGKTDTSDSCAGSTRPGLTRQGSTFKPLNPVKSIDRNKKRSRRTTIMGIPSQVQKELALRRHSTFQQLPEDENTSENKESGLVIIPTVDGGTPAAKKEGARVHLSELEVSREEKLLQRHLQAVYQEEQHFTFQAFGHHTGPGPGSTLRPKSVALPGMTSSLSSPSAMLSFLHEPQGPVMSISPQATYMSTIIPNAVLPSSVDVIEIDRGLRRPRGSSVRTVSKSSLGSGESPATPLSSRRSDTNSSRNDTSQSNCAPVPSLSSNLSESQSSKTLVLVSSPASSKRNSAYSNRLSVSERESQHEHTGDDLASLRSSVSIISSPTSVGEDMSGGQNAEMEAVDEKKLKRRSLSVTKTKLPPVPPQRTNSLHSDKLKNSSQVSVQCQETLPEIEATTTINLPSPNSVVENGATPPKSEASFGSNRDKMERTISPSSGYSSQSGTPTLSPKEFSPTSPEKQKKSPIKPERSTSRASSSPSSSLTSLSSGASESASHQEPPSKDSTITSSLAMEIKGLLNIPSHPKVRAPCPPPAEIWARNRRSVELVCVAYGGGCKVNQATQSQDETLRQAGTQTEDDEMLDEDPTQKVEAMPSESKESVVGAQTVMAGEEVESSGDGTNLQTKDLNKNLPVVTVTLTEERLSAEPIQEKESDISCNGALETHEQNGLTSIDTLTIDLPKFPKDSPPHTPPPNYHPTPPLSRKPPPSTLSIAELQKVQEEGHVSEACWPPPPPPLEEAFEAGDETDFPLPPPPPLDSVAETLTKIDSVNLCEHVNKQDTLSQPVPYLNVALKVDTQSEILANDGMLDNGLSKHSCLKAEEPMSVQVHQTTENMSSSVNFRRQPSAVNRGKEFQARHKSVPIPKEDANIPLVTPSLLQMVRLRSVSVAEEEGNAPSVEKAANVETVSLESCPVAVQSPQSTPQKPVRKSLSVKSTSQPSAVTQPSLRLQEAIRMKTAAMSTRESLLARPVVRLPPYNSVGDSALDMHKSPTSTASFIFSRSSKKVVIDTTGHTPEAQMALKQNLAAELLQVSEQSRSRAFSNGAIKSVPPPVARKPSHGSVGPVQALPGKVEAATKHQIPPLETKTTRVTADTIETLF